MQFGPFVNFFSKRINDFSSKLKLLIRMVCILV